MVQFNQEIRLPSGAELPNSDDTPVDNENQNFIPNLLLFLLKLYWNQRNDWFFGVDMAVYHLVNGKYEQQIGEPFWMPEIGLGIGRGRYNDGESQLEVLYWFDERGNRYLTAEELLARYRERFGELPE